MSIEKKYLLLLSMGISQIIFGTNAHKAYAQNFDGQELFLPEVNLEYVENGLVQADYRYNKLNIVPSGFGNDRQYVVELLKRNDFEKAVTTANEINSTGVNWQVSNAIISSYMARYGECEKAIDLAGRILKTREKYKHKKKYNEKDIDFTFKNMAIAYALCGKLEDAVRLIKGYKEEAERIGDTRNSKKNYYNKIVWKSGVYSAIGASLYMANQKNDAAAYFDYAISLNEKSAGFQKREGYDAIIYSYIQAGLIREAILFSEKVSSDRETYQSLLMSAAYYGDFELVQEMMLNPSIEGKVENAYVKAIILLIDRKSKNPFFRLDLFLRMLFENISLKQNEDNSYIMASMHIAKMYAQRGSNSVANEVMRTVETWVKKTHSISDMPLAYPEQIAKAYTVIDRNPFRAYQVMTDWGYPANKDSEAWGYIIGSAKVEGDDKLLDQVVRGLKRDYPAIKKYSDRKQKYIAGEVKFYSEIGDHEKAAQAAKKVQGFRNRNWSFRSVHASAANESKDEKAFNNFRVSGDEKRLKLDMNPYAINRQKQQAESMKSIMVSMKDIIGK
ncbi:MAG: hypothetical protein ACRBDL_02540 [Alphaproteobacteria bacterium]